MVRDAAVDLLMLRLGKRRDTALRVSIISELVIAQEDLLEKDATLPWFLVSEKTTLATIASNEEVALPSNFLQEWEDGALYIVNDSGTEVELLRHDWDKIKGDTTGEALPKYYDIVGSNIALEQVPDKVYTLYYQYYKKDTSLAGTYGGAGNTENLWLQWAGNLLIAHAGFVLASQYLFSDKMADAFNKQITRANDALARKNTAMEMSNKILYMEGE